MAWGSISLFAGFLEKENSLETLIVIFEKVSSKGFLRLNMKNFEISVLTANSRYLQTAALNNCFHTAQFHFYRIINRFHHNIHQFTIHLFRAVSFRPEWIQTFDHLIQVPSLAFHGTKLLQSHCQKGICFNHFTTSFTSNLDWYDSKTHPRFSNSSNSHSYSITNTGPVRDPTGTSFGCNCFWGFTSLDPAF